MKNSAPATTTPMTKGTTDSRSAGPILRNTMLTA